jgi:hypothetical protein
MVAVTIMVDIVEHCNRGGGFMEWFWNNECNQLATINTNVVLLQMMVVLESLVLDLLNFVTNAVTNNEIP